MKHHIIAAVIVALGLITAAFLLRDRYTMTSHGDQIVRMDRWTGSITACSADYGSWSCETLGKRTEPPAVENLTAENLVIENTSATGLNDLNALSNRAARAATAAHHPDDLDNLMGQINSEAGH